MRPARNWSRRSTSFSEGPAPSGPARSPGTPLAVLWICVALLLGFAMPALALRMPTEDRQEGRDVGRRPFNIELKDLDGRPHSLKDLKGRAVVHVVFWASWC